MTAFVAASATPHVLRLWNYFDAINLGDGDEERYRRFCVGRARGAQANAADRYPAATAIGRRDGVRVLQVYALAARASGAAGRESAPGQCVALSAPIRTHARRRSRAAC